MGYIKSHSNYVLEKKHQNTNDGTIFERDITTIGGLNQFSKGQIPIYQSGNFIITVRSDSAYNKDYTNNDWEKNSNSDEQWTLTNTSSNPIIEEQIVIQKDYYDLRDFAYYGSCSELIRASLTDIINQFPGELYAPIVNGNGIKMFYTNKYKTEEDQTELLQGWFLLDNPFGINIYSQQLTDNTNELRFFCNNGFQKYEIINPQNKIENITDWEVISQVCTTNSNGEIQPLIAKVILNKKYTIEVAKGDDGEIVYLVEPTFLDYHIRPKQEYITNYFHSLDSFQSILLNKNSTPIYTANFEVIKENSYGYYTEIVPFTFPLGFGSYNLAVNDAAYSVYVNDLVDIAAFYDEYFCDNLYRSMTHESIKNFDWSNDRINDNDNLEEYIFGGTKLQKIIRLMGREFDEIKSRIEMLSNSQVISYNNTIDSQIVLNSLITDGWDVKSIITVKKSNGAYINDNLTLQPYAVNNNTCYPNGYFIGCSSNDESGHIVIKKQ